MLPLTFLNVWETYQNGEGGSRARPAYFFNLGPAVGEVARTIRDRGEVKSENVFGFEAWLFYNSQRWEL